MWSGNTDHIFRLNATYALVPIFSCLYFEPSFVAKSSVFSHIVMAVSLYVLSADKYEVVYQHQSRMKSAFMSSMSHEIRTPMNAIIGMTDVALSKDMSDELRRYLTIIKSSSDGLLDIINY